MTLWDTYSTGTGTITCDGHNAAIAGNVLSTYEVVARRNFKQAAGDFQHCEVVFQTTPGGLFIANGHNDLWLRMTNFTTWATRTGMRMRLSGNGFWTLDWLLNGAATNLAVASVPVSPAAVVGSTFGFDAGFAGVARRFRATLNGNPFVDTIEAGTTSQYGVNNLWRGLGGKAETGVNPGLMRQWTATG